MGITAQFSGVKRQMWSHTWTIQGVKAIFEQSEKIASFSGLYCSGCTNYFQLGYALFDLLLLDMVFNQISDECAR